MTAADAKVPLIAFKRHLRAEIAEGQGVYLFAEDGVTLLKGDLVETAVSLMDGTRDLHAVLGGIPDLDNRQAVAGVLAELAQAGLVTLRPASEPADSRTLAYWDAGGLDAATAATQVAAATVALIIEGDLDPALARAALTDAGLTVCDDLSDAGFAVVLCDDYLNPRLADIDARMRAAGVPWLLAKPGGVKTWIGPVFNPGDDGCWNCVAERLWGHRNAERCLQLANGRTGPAASPMAATAASMAMAVHLVAAEATKWIAGMRYPGQRSIWTLDTLTLAGTHHQAPVYPQCRVCGDPTLTAERAARPVVLRSRAKVADGGGGHRTTTPAEVRAKYWHLVSAVTGIVKEIKRDPRGPEFFNAFQSGANVATQARNLGALRSMMRMSNGGKGVTAEQAEVSALCEAIERYCGAFHGDEAMVRASLRSLGDDAIHPNDCLLYDERQHRDRETWNAEHAAFQYVCAPFDPDAEIDWSPVWSLTEQRWRMLPTGQLYFGGPGPESIAADSNGNAAGSSLEDAVLQGLLELVERDAVAIWWYNRTRQPAVDLDAFGDPWTEQLRAVHAGLGREVWVLDVTSDLGVPVMVAFSRRVDGPTEDIIMGFGAHVDARIALRRALTELNQMMPAVVEAENGDGYGCDDPDALAWWRTATLDNQPYLRAGHTPARGPSDYPYTGTADVLDDIARLREVIEGKGMTVLVLDQTRPDIGLPVVKVIVPGLRPFWTRFAPGRLFDVPVELGRLPAPTRFEDLNPMPIFL